MANIHYSNPNQTIWYFERTAITADSSNVGDINTFDTFQKPINDFNGDLTLLVIRTAGATDVIAVAIQVSNDGTNWNDALAEADVTGGASEVTQASGKKARFYRTRVTTVGAANTLSVFATIG